MRGTGAVHERRHFATSNACCPAGVLATAGVGVAVVVTAVDAHCGSGMD